MKGVQSVAGSAVRNAPSVAHAVADNAKTFGQDLLATAPEFSKGGALTALRIAFKAIPAENAVEDAPDATWRQHSASAGDRLQWQKTTGAGSPDLANASFGTYGAAADATTHSTINMPGSMGKLELPGTPGLHAMSSMADLVKGGAIPAYDGAILTDKVTNPSELYADMFKN